MGARGPIGETSLPEGLRVINGGRDDAVETAASALPPTAPDKPEHLPEDVSAAWDSVVPSLEEAGLLARCDGLALELALRHYVIAVRAAQELTVGRKKVTVRDQKNDRTAKHPASQVFRDHSASFLEYAKQLGITFASRARIPMKETGGGGNEENPFAAQG